jgi:hypothetical protein
MPLYNCFSNRLCQTALSLKTTIPGFGQRFGVFDASDANYKIYLIPVKLFKKYTIALDSAYPIEMCCGIYNTKLNLDPQIPAYSQLLEKTYVRKAKTFFGQPFLYTPLADLAPNELSAYPTKTELEAHSQARKFIAQIANREQDLTLLLKVPKDIDSSIVILEGDYVNWNNCAASLDRHAINVETDVPVTAKLNLKHNHTIIANESIFSEYQPDLITPLQLLRLNTKTQVPFSDRLLEYLLEMCITGGTEDVRENILMAQTLLGLRHAGKALTLRYKIYGAADALDNDQKHKQVIYATRQMCQQAGDLYFKDSLTAGGQVCQFNPAGQDILFAVCQGNRLLDINTKETLYCSIGDSWQTTTAEALNYNFQNGVWTPALQKLFYQYMTNNTEHIVSAHHDILGYVDKDVEKQFVVSLQDSRGNPVKKTMMNFNVWEDLANE